MISSVSTYYDNVINAYANICLLADKTWAYDPEDSYRKLNRSLWVKICKLNTLFFENGSLQIKRVRDVIPGSRLALYGNFEYNEEREKSYKSMQNFRIEHCGHCVTPRRYGIPEPWMLPEVEECFNRLSGQISAPKHNEHYVLRTPQDGRMKNNGVDTIVREMEDLLKLNHNTVVENYEGKKSSERCYNLNRESSINHTTSNVDYDKFVPLRYTIDTLEEMELQLRITSDIVRNLWSENPFPETDSSPTHQVQPQFPTQHPVPLQLSKKPQKFQNNQEFRFYNYQNQQTFIKVGHYVPAANQAIGIIRGPPFPILSPEVPEFYSKRCATPFNEYDERGVPLHFFPSTSEPYYPEEVLPYNRRQAASLGPTFQGPSIPILPHPAINTIIQPHQWFHRVGLPLQLQVPVCTPPQAMCATIQPIYPAVLQRPIQLTEKPIPLNQTNAAPIPVYQRPLELYQDYPQRRKNQRPDYNNLILLTKSAMNTKKTQSKVPEINSNIINMKSNSDILWHNKRREEEYFRNYSTEFPNLENKCFCLKTKSSEQNSSYNLEKSVDVNETKINKSQKRRLYRDVLTNSKSTTSIDCEVEKSVEKTYDDLERQAMEQYRTSEECLALRYQELERQALEQYNNGENSSSADFLKIDFVETDYSKGSNDQSSFSENNCIKEEGPEFGSYSSVEGASHAKEIGVLHQSKITISKPEGRFESSDFHHYDSHTNIHSGVIAKSMTTLSSNINEDWKQTSEGASGDVIGTLNQQLILMSALEKKIRPSLINTSDLKSCTSSMPTQSHMHMPSMMQIGGGDEKITYQTSPDSLQPQLFLSDEQLTNSSSNTVGFNHTLSSQQEDETFSELDFQLKSQNELNVLSSEVQPEVQLLTIASGSEDDQHLTDRQFSLKIGHHLEQLLKQGSSSDENQVEESLECYLKRLIWISFSSDPRISPTFENSYLDNFKLEIAMLKNWVESKEEETNLSLETVDLLGRNRCNESVTTEYFDNLLNLLKRAYATLTKMKNDNHGDFEMSWLQFLQQEEYGNEENINADNFVDSTVLEEIHSNRSDKMD